MGSGDDSLVSNHDIDRFDEVGYSIGVMGEYFLRKGYTPETIAEKMRVNARMLDSIGEGDSDA